MLWDDKDIETLRQMTKNGSSASLIAAKLGISRNAVIGKNHRLGLQNKTDHRKTSSHVARKPVAPRRDARSTAEAVHALKRAKKKLEREQQRPTNYFHPVPADATKAQSRCGLMELTADACRWPFGDPRDKDFHFCGGLAVVDLPYCAVHAARAFMPRR